MPTILKFYRVWFVGVGGFWRGFGGLTRVLGGSRVGWVEGRTSGEDLGGVGFSAGLQPAGLGVGWILGLRPRLG
jgi:hypothetical protein